MAGRRKEKSAVSQLRSPGHRLRQLREQLGMTLREVAGESNRIAAGRRNPRFKIQASRLHDFETLGGVPSIFRLYSLALIYHRPLRELLAWYGIDAG